MGDPAPPNKKHVCGMATMDVYEKMKILTITEHKKLCDLVEEALILFTQKKDEEIRQKLAASQAQMKPDKKSKRS